MMIFQGKDRKPYRHFIIYTKAYIDNNPPPLPSSRTFCSLWKMSKLVNDLLAKIARTDPQMHWKNMYNHLYKLHEQSTLGLNHCTKTQIMNLALSYIHFFSCVH